VRSSFSGADFCSDKETTAGNTLCIPEGGDEVWAEIRPEKPVRISVLMP
jgi:hypothetical protein